MPIPDFLIIDEVHERDMETEMLLLLIQNLLDTNSLIKVVLMSATIELEVYRHYFIKVNLTTVSAEGRCHDVEVREYLFC